MLARALRRRCPRCGRSGIFRSWFSLHGSCPRCEYPFEREEGYWVGAIIVNTAVTEILFGALFVAIVVASWPDIAWQPLLAAGLATNGLFPWFFYPYSKTLWMALDLHFHPIDSSRHPLR